MGVQVDVHPADIDETPMEGETPAQYVRRLAFDKAMAVARLGFSDRLVVGADTIIEHEGEILGKPRDSNHCTEMLTRLSGARHKVLSGVAMVLAARKESVVCETTVEFAVLSESQIEAYWATGEPVDKAGSYAIQGAGALFVQRMEGSYSNVVGLPVYETAALFAKFGITTQQLLLAIASGRE
ncbi:septum formation protein Maf [Chromatiales bacterium (ex Bugula neritina AB1)]|nr:septum formation protein Maf [Chromatiales bacterium (ex Bugula neritina AB1)]